MNWYIAKLVYQVIYGNGIFDAQFCEQLRLVEASDELHAFTRAQLLGHTEETVLYSQNEALVQWKFINVVRTYFAERFGRWRRNSIAANRAAARKNIYKNGTAAGIATAGRELQQMFVLK